jgi:hypothetical protein
MEFQPSPAPLSLVTASVLERRSCWRHRANGVVLIRPHDVARPVATPARICDISEGGTRLLAAQRYPPGTRLTLSPVGWIGSPFLVVRVVHAVGEPGRWLLGCEFLGRLSDTVLQHWRLSQWNYSPPGEALET